LEKAFRLARKMESKIMATRKPTTHNYEDESVISPSHPQPTRLTPQQLEEKKQKVFVIVVIANTLKVISVLRKNYFTKIVKRRKKRNKEHQKKRIYTRYKP